MIDNNKTGSHTGHFPVADIIAVIKVTIANIDIIDIILIHKRFISTSNLLLWSFKAATD